MKTVKRLILAGTARLMSDLRRFFPASCPESRANQPSNKITRYWCPKL